jgi:hypothetical protein
VEISGGAIMKYSYESCVKVVNKSNLKSKTAPRATSTLDNICYFNLYPKGLKQATERSRRKWERVKNIVRRGGKPKTKPSFWRTLCNTFIS